MSNQVEFLKKRLDALFDKETDEIVVSLSGSWGVGKTHFWNHYAEKFGNHHAYISLFGKNSLDDVKKEIVLKLFARSVLHTFLEEKFGTADIPAIDFGALIGLLTKADFKGMVICFDDFERISKNLELGEVLGLIAELKEQKKCKIIMLYNSSTFEHQDDMYDEVRYHIKTTEQDFIKTEELVPVERIKKTNIKQVFDSYIEKIVDVAFAYDPSIEDNFNLMKDKLLLFNPDDLLGLLEALNDPNKETNLRYLSSIIFRLNQFVFLGKETIDPVILSSIMVYLFKLNYQIIQKGSDDMFQGIGFDYTFDTIAILRLQDDLEYFYETGKINEESFTEKVIHIHASAEIKNVCVKTDAMYKRYLYDLEFTDADFTTEMTTIITENKTIFIQAVGVRLFAYYLSVLSDINEKNLDAYNRLQGEVMRSFIDSLYRQETTLSYVEREFFNTLLDKFPALKNYYKKKSTESLKIATSSKDTVMDILINVKGKNSASKYEENVLSNVEVDQHIEWIKVDMAYSKVTVEFMHWINSSHGKNCFDMYRSNIIHAYTTLAALPEYKHKMEFILKELKSGVKPVV